MPYRENIDPDDESDLAAEAIIDVPTVDYNDLQCKYCLKRGMHWEQDRAGKYYLALPSGTRHKCREKFTGFVKLPKIKKVKK